MSQHFLVRKIKPEELDALLGLYAELHPDDASLPEKSELYLLWADIILNPLLHYFVGECNGEIVSSCTLAIVPNMTRGARPYGLIENVITRADYCNQGFGTAVLQHALQVAWDAHCYKVMLLTGSQKEETLRFYEGAGFQQGIKTGFIAYPPEDE
jgi:GNAT superfamily N-acetyltransferase